MIDVQKAIYDLLSPVFEGFLYPTVRPETDGETEPTYGVYTRIGGVGFSVLEGDIPLKNPHIQVSIYSVSFADMKAKEAAVGAAMLTAPFKNTSQTEPVDGYEPETKRHYTHITYSCWND